jgi:hypothetical protein
MFLLIRPATDGSGREPPPGCPHMLDNDAKWNELKAKFLRDFLPAEQIFFLKKARECVIEKGYPVSEDLFNYCCFLTLRERLRTIDSASGDGLMRFMLVESRREIDGEVKAIEKRLEERKQEVSPEESRLIIEFLAH